MKKYKVILPVDIAGTTHWFGEVIELDLETALLYRHALIVVNETTEGDQSAHHTDH